MESTFGVAAADRRYLWWRFAIGDLIYFDSKNQFHSEFQHRLSTLLLTPALP
ncbi:hypothetical protein Hanom_Chr08g00732771 [Helianthus anomalus]